MALLELAAELLAIVVNGCKPVPVLEVTVAHGITLQKSVGATVRLKRKPNQEEKEEEGERFQKDVQLDHRVRLEARHVDPLVAVGLEILVVQRGKAEEEATLAERLQDPLQEVAQKAPPTLVLFAKIILWENAKRNRMNAPSGILHLVGSSKRETAKKAGIANICILRLRTNRPNKALESPVVVAVRVLKRKRKEKARNQRKTKKSLLDWPLCCPP